MKSIIFLYPKHVAMISSSIYPILPAVYPITEIFLSENPTHSRRPSANLGSVFDPASKSIDGRIRFSRVRFPQPPVRTSPDIATIYDAQPQKIQAYLLQYLQMVTPPQGGFKDSSRYLGWSKTTGYQKAEVTLLNIIEKAPSNASLQARYNVAKAVMQLSLKTINGATWIVQLTPPERAGEFNPNLYAKLAASKTMAKFGFSIDTTTTPQINDFLTQTMEMLCLKPAQESLGALPMDAVGHPFYTAQTFPKVIVDEAKAILYGKDQEAINTIGEGLNHHEKAALHVRLFLDMVKENFKFSDHDQLTLVNAVEYSNRDWSDADGIPQDLKTLRKWVGPLENDPSRLNLKSVLRVLFLLDAYRVENTAHALSADNIVSYLSKFGIFKRPNDTTSTRGFSLLIRYCPLLFKASNENDYGIRPRSGNPIEWSESGLNTGETLSLEEQKDLQKAVFEYISLPANEIGDAYRIPEKLRLISRGDMRDMFKNVIPSDIEQYLLLNGRPTSRLDLFLMNFQEIAHAPDHSDSSSVLSTDQIILDVDPDEFEGMIIVRQSPFPFGSRGEGAVVKSELDPFELLPSASKHNLVTEMHFPTPVPYVSPTLNRDQQAMLEPKRARQRTFGNDPIQFLRAALGQLGVRISEAQIKKIMNFFNRRSPLEGIENPRVLLTLSPMIGFVASQLLKSKTWEQCTIEIRRALQNEILRTQGLVLVQSSINHPASTNVGSQVRRSTEARTVSPVTYVSRTVHHTQFPTYFLPIPIASMSPFQAGQHNEQRLLRFGLPVNRQLFPASQLRATPTTIQSQLLTLSKKDYTTYTDEDRATLYDIPIQPLLNALTEIERLQNLEAGDLDRLRRTIRKEYLPQKNATIQYVLSLPPKSGPVE